MQKSTSGGVTTATSQAAVATNTPYPSATPLPSPMNAVSPNAAVPNPQGSVQPGGPLAAAPTSVPSPDLTTDANGLSKATVTLNTTEGVIKFKFYPKDAPQTTARIIQLIQQGFYNGLTFHRVVPDFVVQGGDPTGTGAGGSGQNIPAEFNNRHHLEGTVAMARASDPNSADSQFYICLTPQPRLDHQYTVFGQTVEGMDIARKIKVGDKINSAVISN
jgi:cyclophilin family peptidyl-prolyl cis-trans isomerase